MDIQPMVLISKARLQVIVGNRITRDKLKCMEVLQTGTTILPDLKFNAIVYLAALKNKLIPEEGKIDAYNYDINGAVVKITDPNSATAP